MNLTDHLNNSISKEEQVNESLLLGGLLAAACLSTALSGVFDSQFMKSISPGVNSLLSGVGSMFGGFGLINSRIGRGTPSMNTDDLDELLKKNPDDMTGVEKKQLKQIAKSKKYKDNLSNNQIKKLNSVMDALDSSSDEEKDEEKDNDNNNNDNVATEYTPEMMAGLMAMAKKANDEEKDKTKKSENEAMFNIMTACMYDKDGNDVPMEERLEKMKGVVGKDKWESFKADITKKYEENKDNEDFLKSAENAKNNLSKEDAESFVNTAKERAKTTLEKVEKEKKEQAEIDKDIEDLQKEIDKEKQNSVFKPEENEKLKELVDKLKKRQEDREKLAKNSIAGQAAPNAVNNALDIQKKTEEFENAKKEHDNAAKEIEDLKKSLEGKDKDSQEYKDIEKQIADKQNALADLKKKMDDAEAAKHDAEAKAGSVSGKSGKEPEPGEESKKEKTAEELDAEYKEKSKALEKEYQDKIDNETDEAKKKELEDEWTKKQEDIDNELKTAKDKLKGGGEPSDDDTDNEYNSSKDKTNYDDVDNTDEDDDENEYDSDEDDGQDDKKKLQNPAKIWRRKKNKTTGKMTKSYYSKDSKGNEISITRDEFKAKVDAYQKAKKKSKGSISDNNSQYTKLRNYLIEKLNS